MEKLDYSWYNISMEERQRLLKQGCINIWIDEIVHCLKDTVTGEMKETVVFKIESRSYLKQYTEQNGWQIIIFSVSMNRSRKLICRRSDFR